MSPVALKGRQNQGGGDFVANPDWVRDEVILAMVLYVRAGRKQLSKNSREVRTLSDSLNRLPIHPPSIRESSFRNCDGISLILANIESIDKNGRGLPNGSKLHLDVWNDFKTDLKRLEATADAILFAVQSDSDGRDWVTSDSAEEEVLFREGRVLTRLHLARERNPNLVRKKKRDVLKRTKRLACEACGFDFAQFYGEMGHGFAECHHILPLAKLPERKSGPDDLAIVCANCHRMLHTSEAITISELHQRIADART
jgi:5-methylcytosine-specific restriction protein A